MKQTRREGILILIPIANIDLEIEEVGAVRTKVAMVDREVIMEHYYLLGTEA